MTETERLSDRRFFTWLLSLTILAAFLRIYLLAVTQPTGDEFYTIEEAFDYMRRGHYGLEMWHHPKLRNILVFYSIKCWGLNLFGIRFASVLFGVLTVPLTGLVARRLTRSGAASLLAALFMAVDAIHIELSRQAIQEVYMPFFLLMGIYLALRYLENKRAFELICSGLVFGLGLASKWNVAVPLVLTLLFLVFQQLRQHGPTTREKLAECLFYVSALLIIPVTVYILTYFPWFLQRGYDLGEWFATQKIMFAENLVHKGLNPEVLQVQDHSPLLWFIRPVGFADFLVNRNEPVIVLGVSNPFVWLLTLPAVAYLMYNVRRLGWNNLFLLAVFWCSYLPFVLSKRLTGANTALTVTPFAFMAVSAVIVMLLEGKPYRRRLLYAYVGIVLLVAAPLYLMAIGKGFGTVLQPLIELYRPMHER
ncbi:MAG: phospholipid carrier-dependent glycosyltransferase [Oryzomonas sp.]|uniref:phospholipid carrier-dependent glycosyltransferase n=1 Tax=Oryzomonas sp. TaxID=2855186 RepID=UPI00284B281C|nr:phospholipid carrier-dependent glycosyltransferase [Oryzomonas sp.]MDR3581010.1 phospholipid carrier-dependent glycosyltransferase [Oryzomonas sp.]